jgi:DNA primase small subunit
LCSLFAPPPPTQTQRTHKRELVFDIDLTDYDDVRNCCSGAKICHKCWSYMTMAIECLDPALKQVGGVALWVDMVWLRAD